LTNPITILALSYQDTPIGVSKGVFPIREKTGLEAKTDQTRLEPKRKSGSYKKPRKGGGGVSSARYRSLEL